MSPSSKPLSQTIPYSKRLAKRMLNCSKQTKKETTVISVISLSLLGHTTAILVALAV